MTDSSGVTQVFSDYNPENELHVVASDPVTKIPYMTRRAAEILFVNAYIRTVADIADLPKQFPGLASAFAQDEDFKTWSMILKFAEQVVKSPNGVSVNRSALPSTPSTVAQPVAADDSAACSLM